MSQENVELGHRANRAFNRRDIDEFLALCDPDVEFFAGITALEGGGPYRGRDGVRSWYERVLEVSPDFSVEIEEVRDLGAMTFSRVLLRGHGVGSNAPIEQRAWSVARWREKRVVWSQVFLSEAEALKAAELSEQAMSEDNVEIAHRFLDALGRGDYGGAIECLHPDAIWTNTAVFPGARTITGPKAIIDFWKTLMESFDQAEGGLEIENATATGDRVVASVYSRGRGVGSGVPVDVRWALTFSLRDARIERMDVSGDYSSALETAGLSE